MKNELVTIPAYAFSHYWVLIRPAGTSCHFAPSNIDEPVWFATLAFLIGWGAGRKIVRYSILQRFAKKSLVDMGQMMKGLNLEGSSYLPESLDDMQHLKWGLSRIVE